MEDVSPWPCAPWPLPPARPLSLFVSPVVPIDVLALRRLLLRGLDRRLRRARPSTVVLDARLSTVLAVADLAGTPTVGAFGFDARRARRRAVERGGRRDRPRHAEVTLTGTDARSAVLGAGGDRDRGRERHAAVPRESVSGPSAISPATLTLASAPAGIHARFIALSPSSTLHLPGTDPNLGLLPICRHASPEP